MEGTISTQTSSILFPAFVDVAVNIGQCRIKVLFTVLGNNNGSFTATATNVVREIKQNINEDFKIPPRFSTS